VEWGKLFANLPDDPRVQAVEANGGGAWLLVESMCYCTRAERGGFIPYTQVERFGGAKLKQRVAALVGERLWLLVEGGYLINPDIWNEQRNLSDSAEKKKRADRERLAAKREADTRARAVDGAAAASRDRSRDRSCDSRATDRATGRSDNRHVEKSRAEKTLVTAEVSHHLAVPDARARDDDSVISAVAAAAAARTGAPVPDDQVRSAVAVIHRRITEAGIVIHHPATYFAAAVRDEPDVYGLLLADVLARITAAAGPPWCGRCSEDRRWLEADSDHPRKCPQCHPDAMRARTA
jgi:hypothetical protein